MLAILQILVVRWLNYRDFGFFVDLDHSTCLRHGSGLVFFGGGILEVVVVGLVH